ncbi:DUF6412 domain-containing protein [Microbacterium sp. NPDC077391]|uniref:Uncharacterized protein n=1 Tax=Microbacterium commune TaxID=2762219 RepID=A0ABR8W5G8_9MICO|nr:MULTISPECIES: DUF6412 domain-containing protein [Microbacterium]MBD8012265.1 hypothetical protein [Microbacterium commune]OIU88257.1 hypothetical protein BFN01_00405 [Microbacterium sp. AR7-10]
MIDAIGTLLRTLLVALGAVPLPPGLTAGGMLGIAAILVAATVLAIALALLTPRFGVRSAPYPRRAIGASVLLAQSDPDADGHPRPRAPGAAPAA